MYADRDVLGCDSSLVDDLIKAASSGELSGDLRDAFEYEGINGLYPDLGNWDADQCREWLKDHSVDIPETDEYTDSDCEDALRDLVRDNGGDEPAEVYEWWRVSSWLCDQLKAIGEVTIDNGYGHWWGRTCTGQQWIMDGTLQQVAAQFEREVAA